MKNKFRITTGSIEIANLGMTTPNIEIEIESDATLMELSGTWDLTKRMNNEFPAMMADLMEQFNQIARNMRPESVDSVEQECDDTVFSEVPEQEMKCVHCGKIITNNTQIIHQVTPGVGNVDAFCCPDCYPLFVNGEVVLFIDNLGLCTRTIPKMED